MDNLFHQVINRNNLIRCARQIKGNGCTAVGVDNISNKMAVIHITEHMEEIICNLKRESYKPLPIRRTGILKSNGDIRFIGIPSVTDKIIQLSMVRTLSPIYEEIFSDSSYGFRPKRNIHQAIAKAKEFINDGYIYMIEMDLEKFFDTLHHDKLMSELYKTIKDRKVLRLIRKYLQSEIIYHGKRIDKIPDRGAIQGGNLSPLLANVYLHQLDMELSQRGIKFIRYADDIAIFMNSLELAESIKENISKFVELKLLLKVNQKKTRIVVPTECRLLGFGFYDDGGIYKTYVPESAIENLKDKLNNKIHKANTFDETIKSVNDEIRGWSDYYLNADKFMSIRKAKSIDRSVIEKLYKMFPNGMCMKEYKEWLYGQIKIISLVKITERLNIS